MEKKFLLAVANFSEDNSELVMAEELTLKHFSDYYPMSIASAINELEVLEVYTVEYSLEVIIRIA